MATPPPSRPRIDSRTVTRPRKTKSQLLRENKNVAVVVPEAQAEASRKPSRPAGGYGRTAPPPRAPKKVLFNQPKMTKAMLARQAAAQEKILEDQRKQAALEAAGARRRGPGPHASTGAVRRRSAPRKTQSPCKSPIVAAAAEILEQSRHEAQAGQAEVVQAVAVGDGDVATIIIPPGAVSEDQTTIVQIVPAEEVEGAVGPASPETAMNQSIQMLSDSLTEQEAAESSSVGEALGSFHSSRRGLMMELAGITLAGLDPDLEVLDVDKLPLGEFADPPTPPRQIYRIPDLDHPMFQLQYGRDDPRIVAAREFLARDRQRAEERRQQQIRDDPWYGYEGPPYQNIMDASFSYEEQEESEEENPCQPGGRPPLPRWARPQVTPPNAYRPHSTMKNDFDELEKFFNIAESPIPRCRPRTRRPLNRDLRDVDDPWKYGKPIDYDLIDFSA